MRIKLSIVNHLLLGLLLLTASTISAQQKWTIDDILKAERIINPIVSSNGEYVFYLLGSTKNGYPVKPSEAYTITSDGKNINCISNVKPLGSNYAISPDSKRISFISKGINRSKLNQVWCVSPTGDDIEQLTYSDRSVYSYLWSPNNDQLLYTTVMPQSSEEIAYKQKWGVVISPEEKKWDNIRTLWIKDIKAESAIKLTEATIRVNPEWSPSGEYIAFCGNKENQKANIFIFDTHELSGQSHKYRSIDENASFLSWSPDGKELAFIARGHIWLYNISTKEKKQITNESYPQLYRFKWSRSGDQLAFIAQEPSTYNLKTNRRYLPTQMYVVSMLDLKVKSVVERMDFYKGGKGITWSRDDSEIWFYNGDKMGSNLYSTNVASGIVRNITTGQDFINHVTFDKDFKTCVFTFENINTKPDLYVSKTLDWSPKRITDINPWVSDYANGYGEIVTYKSDGLDIDALVIKPPNFNPEKKYPLLLIIHGGPNWYKLNEWSPDWEHYPIHAYSAADYVLMLPNVRGSANYGHEFRKAIQNDLGGGDVRDALRGVDYLLDQGYIDEDNIGVCGWSYGGYLTPSIISQTDRFKAAQFGAGLPSHEAMYGSLSTVEHILHTNFDSRPWENGMTHIQYSPLYYTNKVKTPTLIQHGEKDPRCPVSGAILYYKALQYYNVPTVLEIYPGMGHSITDPLLYKRVLNKNLEWFNKWLKDDSETSFESLFSSTNK